MYVLLNKTLNQMTNVYANVNAVLTPGWHLPLFVAPVWTSPEQMIFDVQLLVSMKTLRMQITLQTLEF